MISRKMKKTRIINIAIVVAILLGTFLITTLCEQQSPLVPTKKEVKKIKKDVAARKDRIEIQNAVIDSLEKRAELLEKDLVRLKETVRFSKENLQLPKKRKTQ